MGIASLVLGILALIVSFVPCVGVYALVFSILGVILGAVGIVKAKKSGEGKGLSIGGLVCNIVATAIAIWWFVVMGAVVTEADNLGKSFNDLSNELDKGKEALSDRLKKTISENLQTNVSSKIKNFLDESNNEEDATLDTSLKEISSELEKGLKDLSNDLEKGLDELKKLSNE